MLANDYKLEHCSLVGMLVEAKASNQTGLQLTQNNVKYIF